MLYDGIKLTDSAVFEKLNVQHAETLPVSGNLGELFYLENSDDPEDTLSGLYVFDDAWRKATNAPILDPTIQFVKSFVATANQTLFEVPESYESATAEVTRNGVNVPVNFTSVDSFTLLQQAWAGDIVEIVWFSVLRLGDALKRSGDTMTGFLEVPAGAAGNQVARANETLLRDHSAAAVSTTLVDTDVMYLIRGGQVYKFSPNVIATNITAKSNNFTAIQQFSEGLKTSKSYSTEVITLVASDIDCSAGNYFYKSISTNTTFTFSNAPAAGYAYGFILEVDHVGGNITWPLNVQWPNVGPGALISGKRHNFSFKTRNGGLTWDASALTNYGG